MCRIGSFNALSSFHQYKDPRQCVDIGTTTCCTDVNNEDICEVRFRNVEKQCSCDVYCHSRKDCCSDALTMCIRKSTKINSIIIIVAIYETVQLYSPIMITM